MDGDNPSTPDKFMNYVFTDGGVALRNPSKIGGSWCYIILEDSNIIEMKSGFVQGHVTSNYMEMIAAYEALRVLPDMWEGEFISDSKVTLGRLFHSYRWNNIPESIRTECLTNLARLGTIKPVFVKGHNNKSKDFYSIHNIMCDRECRRLILENTKGIRENEPN